MMNNKLLPYSLLIILLSISSNLFGQTLIDFEANGNGASYTWAVFENDNNPALEIVANPDVSGINSSSTVAKFTARAAGQPYAGTETAHGDIPTFSFNAENSTVTIMVYKTVISDVGLKFAESNGEAQPEVKVANTKTNEWEKLTFDLSGSIGKGVTGIIDQVIVFPDFDNRSQENIIYFDNISFSTEDTTTPEELELVWSDEFSEDGAINVEKWHHQTQLPNGGNWYNGELQHYTNRTENSLAANGFLSITAKKETFTDQGVTKDYTSARLNSRITFTYGRVDVMAMLPEGDGTWPAIWTLGKNINEPGGYWAEEFGTVNWPQCGEIDIMEHWGNNPNVIHGSTHTPSSSGGTVNTGTKTIDNVSSTFHLYSMIWDVDKIDFLIDDVVFYTYQPAEKNSDTWPFDKPQYLLLNVAMGGTGGAIDPAFTESSMKIDYVRVFQKKEDQLTDPVVAAPAPMADAANVISVFSDSYTNVSGTDLNPNWNQSTVVTEVSIEGNNTLKYENLNYQGIELGSSQDVTTMKSLHLDYWTADASALAVSLISTGPQENSYDMAVEKGKWVSVDVPLTAFTVPSLDDIIQLKFDGSGTVYLDNIYFTSEEEAVEASLLLSDLQVDGQTIDGFSTTKFDYTVQLAEGTTTVPTVTATVEDETSSFTINEAVAIPGATTVEVSNSGVSEKTTYTVNFKLESSAPSTLPISFEEGSFGFVDFDGGVATVINNPHKNDDNASDKVAQIVRDGGAVWGGSKLILESKLDFSLNNSFQMKVYSTRADVPVLLKLEGPNAAKEVIVNTTVANGWETMTWDYTGTPSDTYDQLVFMFDIGTAGDGTANSTFLFDDVEFFDRTGGKTRLELPVDFEEENVDYTLSDFGDNSTVLGADPEDASNTVAITTKKTGAATWAGTTIGTEFGFGTAIPFTSTDTKLNVKIYSPAAGLPIRMKAEDHTDVTLTVETEAMTTKANAWEVLTFDFSVVATGTNPFNPATNFDKLSIFFNFGKEGTGQVFYWDDVFFGEGAVPVLSLFDEMNVHLYTQDQSLHIEGNEQLIGSHLSIYTLSGAKVADKILSTQESQIEINRTGLFIVSIIDASGQSISRRKVFLN